MILFIHGEDTYRSLSKLRKIRERFLSGKNASSNFSEFEAGEHETAKMVETLQAMPFLANKRLTVIRDLLSNGKKEDRELIEGVIAEDKIPDSTIAVFYEGCKADKRTVLYRLLNKPKQSEEYKPVEGSKLNNWIDSEVKRLGGRINRDAVEKLILFIGNDLWRLSNEIKKLVSYKENSPITAKDVQENVSAKFDDNIFDLVDAIGSKNSGKALELLGKQIEAGKDPNYLLSMIVYQFRNLILVRSTQREGIPPRQMASALKMHPYVVRKTLNQLRGFDLAKLKKIYFKLLETDLKLKSSEGGDPQTVLSTLIIDLCGR